MKYTSPYHQPQETTWMRVKRDHPCPICGRPDWCTVAADDSAACCMRVESGKPARNGGWVHRLIDDYRPAPRRHVVRSEPKLIGPDVKRLVMEYARSAHQNDVDALAESLGLSPESLDELNVGRTPTGAWTFPMRDARGCIIGIRLRLLDGSKISVRGSKAGLFIPQFNPGCEPWLVCEGPTDTAAMRDLGFNAIGRASCSGGHSILVDFTKRRQIEDMVIVADHDTPGQRGAKSLAVTLAPYCRLVRVVAPPTGIKDARAWLQAGATKRDVVSEITKANPAKIKMRSNAR